MSASVKNEKLTIVMEKYSNEEKWPEFFFFFLCFILVSIYLFIFYNLVSDDIYSCDSKYICLSFFYANIFTLIF